MLLVSPAEPKSLCALGEVSSLPETYGADFLLTSPVGLIGCQRKEVRDLIASIRGDRICREIGQSRDLVQMVLIVEGDWRWLPNGQSQAVDGFLRTQFDGLMLSFQANGWWVLHSESIHETAEMLGRIQSWFSRGEHTSLLTRPKSWAPWGTHLNREYGIYFWQSFPGVGIGMAGVLYDQLGLPLGFTCTRDELLAVPGIGPGRADKILGTLDTSEKVTT